MNKFLSFLGLVKTKRAKHLTGLLHLHYTRCVTNGVHEDFGGLPIKDASKRAIQWWDEEFDRILEPNTDSVQIITNPIFID